MTTVLGLLVAIGLGVTVWGLYWLFAAPKEPIRGPIVEKYHKPYSKSQKIILIGAIPMPKTFEYPEQWILIVNAGRHEAVVVSKEEWDKYNVGDHYG